MIVNKNTIKELRENLRLSQDKMSKQLGITRSYYSQIETGKRIVSDELKKKIIEMNEAFERQRELNTPRFEEQRVQAVEQFKKEEHKKEINDNVTKTRKSITFVPKIEPSIDMIWLRATLGHELRTDFEYYMRNLTSNDLLVEYMNGDGVKSGKYNWLINCLDGKICVNYDFYDQGSLCHILKVQFNPNKVRFDNEYLLRLMYYLGENPLVRKFDVCKDYVGVNTSHLISFDNARRMVKKYVSAGENPAITYYVGDMNKNGCRLYDKKAELRDKDNQEIAYECSRIEYRCTLDKSKELHDLASHNYETLFPVFVALNKGLTELDSKYELDTATYCMMVMLLEDRVSLNQFTRTQKAKLRELLNNKKTETITLTSTDIQLACLKFISDYDFVYTCNYKPAIDGEAIF